MDSIKTPSLLTLQGSCLCGAIGFEAKGAFTGFYLCHCQHCQKDTGSAHGANVFLEGATIEWLKGVAALTTYTLPGTRHSKSFCQHCGSALPTLNGSNLLVPAGCLDKAPPLTPTAHLFTASMAEWEPALGDIPRFKALP